MFDVARRPRLAASIKLQRERLSFEALGAAADFPDRRDHAAVTAKGLVGKAYEMDVRRRGGGGAPHPSRDLRFIDLRVQRAGGDEGARRRTADARETMDYQRLGLVPRADEIDQALDMPAVGENMSLRFLADVGNRDL